MATESWGYYVRLVRVLATRDIAARFRESLLGLLWLILRPVMLMLVVSVVRGIMRIPSDGIPYPLFSFVAISAWLMFATSINGVMPSITRNSGILKKMQVPRILFPFAGSVVVLIEYAATWIPLIGLLIYFQWGITWAILFVPVLVLLVLALGLGIGLIVASFGVYRRDVTIAMPFLIQLAFFLSPIMYPLSMVPEDYRWLYELNPMAGILEGFRSAILHGVVPDLGLLIPALVAIVIVWAIALPLFNYMSRYFADVL